MTMNVAAAVPTFWNDSNICLRLFGALEAAIYLWSRLWRR